MNIWNAFPFVRYSIALIIGIMIYSRVPELWDRYQITLLACAIPVLLTAFFFRVQNLELFRVLSGFFTLFMLVYLGGILAELNDESKTSDHYRNHQNKIIAFSGTIISDHFEREDYFRYEFLLDQILIDSGYRDVAGRIYLYQRKDSLQSILSYGTQLFIQGNFFEIEGPKNPDEFNYKLYLARKNIFAHAFVSTENIYVVGEKPGNPLLNIAYKVRTSSSTMISDFIPGPQEAAVLNALLIGVKDYLDTEIKEGILSCRCHARTGSIGIACWHCLFIDIPCVWTIEKNSPGKSLVCRDFPLHHLVLRFDHGVFSICDEGVDHV